jgi:predicted lysophospholipase L1 biosynthesis ABC-type transport system permease subunit
VLLGVVGFALLTACCNVASIMLARGAFRTREFAMRAALGASRGRLLGQVLAESLLLSAVGGVLGVLLGNHALALLLSQAATMIPSWMKFPLDARCVLFCVAVVGAAGLSGLLPAFHATFPRTLRVLQSAGTVPSPTVAVDVNAIVTAEIALALMLLIGAACCCGPSARCRIDPGFRAPESDLQYPLPIGPYFDEHNGAFWDQHLEESGGAGVA